MSLFPLDDPETRTAERGERPGGTRGEQSLAYEPVPRDPARGFASGAGPYRVLASATDAFCGRGVPSHASGLIGRLATELAAATGHGVDVEVARPTVESAAAVVDEVRLAARGSTDAVVVELEPELLVRRRLLEIRPALQALCDDLPAHTAVVVLVQPPAAPEVLVQLDRLIGDLPRDVRLLPLPAVAGGARAVYASWGRALACAVAAELRFPLHWVAEPDRLDERLRLRSLQRLSVLEPVWDHRLHEVVERAKAAYRSRGAAISLVGRSTVAFAPRIGPVPPELDRADAICGTAIADFGGLIVGDARSDSRFQRLPGVRAGQVRFYAAYRFRDPRGVPVGTVCVYDDAPRAVSYQDLTALRDLAADAERSIAQAVDGT